MTCKDPSLFTRNATVLPTCGLSCAINKCTFLVSNVFQKKVQGSLTSSSDTSEVAVLAVSEPHLEFVGRDSGADVLLFVAAAKTPLDFSRDPMDSRATSPLGGRVVAGIVTGVKKSWLVEQCVLTRESEIEGLLRVGLFVGEISEVKDDRFPCCDTSREVVLRGGPIPFSTVLSTDKTFIDLPITSGWRDIGGGYDTASSEDGVTVPLIGASKDTCFRVIGGGKGDTSSPCEAVVPFAGIFNELLFRNDGVECCSIPCKNDNGSSAKLFCPLSSPR